MTALKFAAWMIAHPVAPYDKLVELFESLNNEEQEKLREASLSFSCSSLLRDSNSSTSLS